MVLSPVIFFAIESAFMEKENTGSAAMAADAPITNPLLFTLMGFNVIIPHKNSIINWAATRAENKYADFIPNL